MEDELRREIVLSVISGMPSLGKTKLQKSLYFLQESLDVPLGFDFVMYHYGPYSQDINNVLTEMSAHDKIRMSGYLHGDWVGYQIQPNEEENITLPSKYAEQIELIVAFFKNLDAEETELCATIHFVKAILAEKKQEASRDDVVREVINIKPKFSPADIYSWIDKLVFSGLMSNI
jgi:uncharacterized protein YwgA